MHYYEHNIGDYRRDTGHLTLLEHGIYRSLLDTYYLTQQPLCADHAKLMRLHCIRTASESKALENVLSDFFVLTDRGYEHKRCEAVIDEYAGKSAKSKNAAEARWAKNIKSDAGAMPEQHERNARAMPEQCQSNANAMPEQCQSNANAMPEQCERNARAMPEQCQSNANAMPEQCERNANAMPTINHKPLTNNHKPLKPKNTTPSAVAVAPKFDFGQALIEAGVPEDLIAAWLRVRKEKRAVNTEHSFAAFNREVEKTGMPIADVVQLCVERSWSSFNANWSAANMPQNEPARSSRVAQLGKHGAATAENAAAWLAQQSGGAA